MFAQMSSQIHNESSQHILFCLLFTLPSESYYCHDFQDTVRLHATATRAIRSAAESFHSASVVLRATASVQPNRHGFKARKSWNDKVNLIFVRIADFFRVRVIPTETSVSVCAAQN